MNNVITKPKPTAPKGLIYGGPGIGKTTMLGVDGAINVDCENGAGTVKCARTPYLESWAEIENWLTALETEKHDYSIVCIDTVDWLVRRLEEHVCGSSKTGQKTALEQTLNKSHGGYGNGKQVLKNYIYRVLLPIFDRLVSKGIVVVLLAHAKRTEITNTDGVTIEKTAPDLPDDYINTFMEWADFCCVAQKDVEGKRYLLTTETNQAIAKNRYGMPPSIPMTWGDFTRAVNEGLKATLS